MKLFHVIATSVLGTAMALGTGFALANKQNVRQVRADGEATISGLNAEVNGHDANKVGGKSSGGTVNITVPKAATSLTYHIAAWKGKTNQSVSISATGATVSPTSDTFDGDDGVTSESPFTLSGNEEDFEKTIEFSNVTAAENIVVTLESSPRFVVWGATYQDTALKTMTIKDSGSVASDSYTVNYGNAGALFYAYEDSSEISPTWESSDETIFTVEKVDKHVWVKGVKAGTAKLNATLDGYKKASVNITINPGDLSNITVTGSMTKTEYASNETWSHAGLIVTANYEYGYSVEVSDGVTWSYSPETPALNVTSVIATATFGDKSASSSAQSVTVTEAAGTIDNPYTVAQALDATPDSGSSSPVYVRGIVIGTPDIDVTKYYNATFYIGDSKDSEQKLNIFRIKDIGNENFSDANKIKAGDTVVVYGVLTKYNSTKELTTGSNSGYLISITPAPVEYTPISWFYEDGHISQTASGPYTFKGTVIGIQSNTYYLQQDQHGIMVYGGTTEPPEGMKIGDLVEVTAKVLNYKNHLVETDSKSSITANILGTGTMPAATVVSTATAFAAVNQSTYVTFNGLKLKGGALTWTSTFVSKTTDGIATISDGAGNSITIFVSKHLDNGAAIVSAMNAIEATDTFDIAKGVRAVNSSNGDAQLAILDEKQITVHHQYSDLVQDWIDEYMYMDDESFDGDGTGRCMSDNLYITAKRALVALGETNVTKFRTNDGNKYTDALARYNEWARINGDTKPFEGDEIVPASFVTGDNTVQSNLAAIIVTMSVVALVSSVGFFLVIRKRKHQ